MCQLQSRAYKLERRKKKRKPKSVYSSSPDSDMTPGCASRPDSGSMTNSSVTRLSPDRSSKSSCSRKSPASIRHKKKSERGLLRVSINETAELIESHSDEHERSSTPCNNNITKTFDFDSCEGTK